MATKKSGKKAAGGEGSSESYEKDSRCWPGYTPVPGKGEHEQGSCRKEPASKNGGQEVKRETARKKQISMGGKRATEAKSKSPNAAERRSVSKTARDGDAAAKKAPAKKVSAKKAATKKAPAKKAVAKKAPARRSPPAKAPRKAAKRAPRRASTRRA